MNQFYKSILPILVLSLFSCSSDDDSSPNIENFNYKQDLVRRTFKNYEPDGTIFEKFDSYFDNGKLTTINQIFFGKFNDDTSTFEYNSEGLIIGGLTEEIGSNKRRKFDIVYDENNKMSSYTTSYDYDISTEQYTRFEKSYYTWIDNTNCEVDMNYQDNRDPLTFKEKDYYTSNGLLYKIVRSDFVGDNSLANSIAKNMDITYDSNSNVQDFRIDNDFYEVRNATFKENQFSSLFHSLTADNIYTPVQDDDQDIIYDISLNDFENADVYKNGVLDFEIRSEVDANGRITKRELTFSNGYKKVEEFVFKN